MSRLETIDHATLMQVSGGAIRVRPAKGDKTTIAALETVKTAVEDLVRDQKNSSSSSSSSMMPMMMMMMMKR
jgi:hypothetical protein